MNYLSEQKRTLSFRRLPFAAKRRRARPLVAAARRAWKIAAVLVPLALLCGWFVSSERFAFESAVTEGIERVDPAWIDQHVVALAGSNLLLADLRPIRAALENHPWIAELRLQKELPRRLIVTVDEHTPAAVLVTDDESFLLSPAGERIVAVVEGTSDAELPPMRIVDSGNAMVADQMARLIELGRLLERSGTPWARRVETVRVLSPEDVELHFLNVGLVVRARTKVTFAGLEDQLATVHELLPQLEDRLGRFQAVDLRFERRLVLVPVEDELAPSPREPASRNTVQTSAPSVVDSVPTPVAGLYPTQMTPSSDAHIILDHHFRDPRIATAFPWNALTEQKA